jgi:pimeloyl-ACP methyl ester carboxylesterase
VTTVRVDGLAVDRLGDPDGPTVVIVHGTMDRASSFRRAARRAVGLDVVLYDRRGYARSLAAGVARDVPTQVADLLEVVAWTGAEDVCVVGHSLGGLLALHAAAARPDVISCVGAWEPPMAWFDWYTAGVGERAAALGRLEEPAAAAEHFLRGMIGEALWERMPQAMRDERRAEGVALVADLELCRLPSAALDFGTVRQPVLVGCGAESAERFRRSADHLMSHLPDAVLVEVAESNHGVHLSHPAEFGAFIVAARAQGRAVAGDPS